ncbi:MAG: GNAT family N-acetyltransferase [Planctomycetota bacterium]
MAFIEFEWCTPLYQQSLELRHRALRDPLGLKFTAEELDAEFKDRHFGWTTDDGDLIAAVLAHRMDATTARLRQMVVSPAHQRHGIGRQLLAGTETALRDEGVAEFQLHARETAIPFYESSGYVAVGDPFQHVGLTHQTMSKSF